LLAKINVEQLAEKPAAQLDGSLGVGLGMSSSWRLNSVRLRAIVARLSYGS
jgi:hypothetical protein